MAMKRLLGMAVVAALSFIFANIEIASSSAQNVLNAAFTSTPIVVDGVAEAAWSKAPAQKITICMNPTLTQQLSNCAVTGTVQALWNGPLLYLLFTVTDPDITTASPTDTNRSSVQVYVDQYNDKFPKFEEDDGYVIVSAAAQQTGNLTNAGLKYYPTNWSSRLQSYAAQYRYDTGGNKIGYTVEVGWYIGDRPLKNGTKLGMEFVINAASSATQTNQYQIYWNSGNNQGVNSNTMWGTVQLSGYNGISPMQLNTFMLNVNIDKAVPAPNSYSGLVRGIWTNESEVDRALNIAQQVQASATSQREIDPANGELVEALRNLRRCGKYPDPLDLPAVDNLPDPFVFFNGRPAQTPADWQARRAEIKDLMQYYEFGYMPHPPQSLTATSTANSTTPVITPAGGTITVTYKTITLNITDNGKTASFSPTLYLPTTGTRPIR
jgi:hypothetical protein